MTKIYEQCLVTMTTVRQAPPMSQIPLVDVRDGGPIAHALSRQEAAEALRDYCVAAVPSWGRGVCLASIDRLAARWLKSSVSAYREELQLVAAILGFPGTLTLNMSYLFACTTSASLSAEGRPMIRRSLDWPFRRARALRRDRVASRSRRRILQRHLARRGRRAERYGARTLLRGDQSGADAPARAGAPRRCRSTPR